MICLLQRMKRRLMGHTIPKTVRVMHFYGIYLIKMPNIITHSVSYGNTFMDVCNAILFGIIFRFDIDVNLQESNIILFMATVA